MMMFSIGFVGNIRHCTLDFNPVSYPIRIADLVAEHGTLIGKAKANLIQFGTDTNLTHGRKKKLKIE